MSTVRKLIVKGPTYFSPGDEKAFFDWLLSIPCVGKVSGHLRELHILLKRQPTDAHLREFIALFYRYRMNMVGLAALKTERNASWFAEDQGRFWHKRVFGAPKSRKLAMR